MDLLFILWPKKFFHYLCLMLKKQIEQKMYLWKKFKKQTDKQILFEIRKIKTNITTANRKMNSNKINVFQYLFMPKIHIIHF